MTLFVFLFADLRPITTDFEGVLGWIEDKEKCLRHIQCLVISQSISGG